MPYVYNNKGLQELANDAYKESCKAAIRSIIDDPNPTERQHQWLKKILLTKEHTLMRILSDIESLHQEE